MRAAPRRGHRSRRGPPGAEDPEVKFERLVLESPTHQTVLELHPSLTVVCGVGPLERESLVGEFVGSLGSARPGVHLELCTDDRRHLAVFRPMGAPHRVVDVDRRADVTGQFVGPDGSIDLLAPAGLDPRDALRLMRLTSQALTEATEGDEIAAGLAAADQRELWTAAELLLEAREHLDAESARAGTSATDAEVVARIEQRHAEFERSQEQSEGVRKVTFVLAGLAALAAVPAAERFGSGAVGGLAAFAALAVVVSVVFWRRTEAARRREEDALAEAGARSYLGFHLQRVNTLMSSDLSRRRLLKAAEVHQRATGRWQAVAGDTDVDWVLARRTRISAAARLGRDGGSGGATTDAATHRPADEVAELHHAVSAAMAALRDVGGCGESYPLLVDEAFAHVERTTLPALLELLMRGARRQQVVVLTADPSIQNWAQLEAMAGTLGVVELRPTVKAA